MPTAPVDDKGTVLYYEDTGAPSGSTDYVTVVLVHGLTFHGAIFERVLPYGAAHNMRFVTVNMRDYPGSTGYTPEELAALADPDLAVQDAALRTHGEQLAACLQYLVRHLGIQPIEVVDGRRTKGLALLTWSMGNLLGMAFLGNAGKYPETTRTFLDKYLRTLVMYDSANSVLGRPPAVEGVYHPLRDASLTPAERGARFVVWVSAYFETAPALEDVTAALLAARREDAARPATVARMSAEDLRRVTDDGALMRSSTALLRVARDVLHANARAALADTGGVCPGVDVLLLWCDQTMHDCVWAAKWVAELACAAPEEGQHRRRIGVKRLRYPISGPLGRSGDVCEGVGGPTISGPPLSASAPCRRVMRSPFLHVQVIPASEGALSRWKSVHPLSVNNKVHTSRKCGEPTRQCHSNPRDPSLQLQERDGSGIRTKDHILSPRRSAADTPAAASSVLGTITPRQHYCLLLPTGTGGDLVFFYVLRAALKGLPSGLSRRCKVLRFWHGVEPSIPEVADVGGVFRHDCGRQILEDCVELGKMGGDTSCSSLLYIARKQLCHSHLWRKLCAVREPTFLLCHQLYHPKEWICVACHHRPACAAAYACELLHLRR